MIDRSSSQEDVITYLKDKCPWLLKSYPEEIFRDLDGEVFLGLSPASVDLVFPQLSQRDKGLLLARSESIRTHPEVRDVTPPPSFAHSALTLPPAKGFPDDKRPIGRLDEGRFQSSYRRDFSPASPSKRRQSPSRESSSVAPIVADLPRILIELWRSTDHPDRDDFLAETWLPDLRELDLKSPRHMRLSLRRSVQRRDSGKVILTRSWLGVLSVEARFFRIGNRIELSLGQASSLNVATNPYSNFFLKVYVYTGGQTPSLTQVHETARREVSTASCVDFGTEQIVLRFSDVGSENKFSFQRPETGGPLGLESPEKVRDLMLRTGSGTDGKVSLYDLMVFVGKGELTKLNPINTRFDAYLLVTHEINAFFGLEFTFKSIAQIEFLKRDSDYMRSQSQLIDLLLLSWGLVDDSQGSWTGDSWLFRQAVLSAILLGNKEGFKALCEASNTLLRDRLLELDEDGFGEALFTLNGDLGAAKKFWNSPQRRSGIRSPYLPDQRATLRQLLSWSF